MGSLFGGGKKKTKVAPPDYVQPYLQQGLTGASNIYNQGKTVVPFSPDSTTAQNMVRDRATAGDPTIGAATDYVQKSLNGGFLNANPYLDKTFEQARLATQNGISSEFARGGRNVAASEQNRAQQVNDLATNIYGGAYNTDRQLQQGTLQYAQPLGNQAYTDAGALSASGAQQENKAQAVADAPAQNLADYLKNIGSINYGQTQTQTEKADPLTTIAGGLTTLSGLAQGANGSSALGGLGGLFGSAGSTALPGIAGSLAAPAGGLLSGAGAGIGASGVAAGSSAVGGLGSAGFGGGLASTGAAGIAPAAAPVASSGGFGAAALAAAPWVAAALGVAAAGAVVANNVAKSSPLNDFNVNTLGWDKPQNFDNTKFSAQELNTYFGPAIQVFAQTGDAQKALAAIPQPRTDREQIMLKGGAKALFGGTGNPFRQIAKAKGFGEGIWTAGNKDKKAAIAGINNGMFGSVGITNPDARMVA